MVRPPQPYGPEGVDLVQPDAGQADLLRRFDFSAQMADVAATGLIQPGDALAARATRQLGTSHYRQLIESTRRLDSGAWVRFIRYRREPVGVIIADGSADEGYRIDTVFVDGRRRQQLGSYAVQRLLLRTGPSTVRASVMEGNKGALAFFRSLDFVPGEPNQTEIPELRRIVLTRAPRGGQ